jgi:hypothetical protein
VQRYNSLRSHLLKDLIFFVHKRIESARTVVLTGAETIAQMRKWDEKKAEEEEKWKRQQLRLERKEEMRIEEDAKVKRREESIKSNCKGTCCAEQTTDCEKEACGQRGVVGCRY